MRKPDFNNLLQVLNNKKPERATLFELFLNDRLYRKLADTEVLDRTEPLPDLRIQISAFCNSGYDYATVHGSDFHFPLGEKEQKESHSLNEGGLIKNRQDFIDYPWPDPAEFDYSRLELVKEILPPGMKVIVMGPSGVLENTIALVGYERLCYLLTDDPELATDIFSAVGSRLVEYYALCTEYEAVGAFIANDDWGFKTQTMLAPDDMRKYVFPWHERIVSKIHSSGKPVILHSCGNLEQVMEDIIEKMKFDARHSFEDSILPVEEAYDKWGDRIAILGGIDMDFMCQKTPREIKDRARAMLEKTAEGGGYALGTGNSVPEYVPEENFRALIEAAHSFDYQKQGEESK